MYAPPDFLTGHYDQNAYGRWLQRKASAHVRRDRKRGNASATVAAYKLAIHNAVCTSQGRDAYTGEFLDWHLLSVYDNAESKVGRRGYKARFSLLPTVDHVGDGLGAAEFLICAWRTNDAKNDLSHADFIALCRKVIAHSDSRRS